MLGRPGPTPRIQGRYFVVAPGTRLPRRCVRTGRTDDLLEINEEARNPFGMQRLVPLLGPLFAFQSAPLTYFIQRPELERLKAMRRWCGRGLWLAFSLIAAGLALHLTSLAVAGFVLTCALVATYWLLPMPISVAAVWGGQVFLLKIPSEIVTEMLCEPAATLAPK